MTLKKIITIGAILIGMLGLPVFAGKISMQPSYNDPRFAPADMFHAGCLQDAQFSFLGSEKNISKVHIELAYVPEDLEISRIIGANQVIANYRIEYDRVIFDIDAPKIDGETPLFHIAFSSKETTNTTSLSVATGSYFVSNGKIVYLNQQFALQFSSVPECDPDVVAPSIDLVSPKDPTERIALDQYFVFQLKDSGKGIDKQSVRIQLNDELYTADSTNIKWKGDYLTFYPQNRLPINKKITITLNVNDKQSYGGANAKEKTFTFKTATGMVLLDNIDPMAFRLLSRDAKALVGTPEECLLLQNIHATADSSFQLGILSIIEKLSCGTVSQEEVDLFNQTHQAAPEKTQKLGSISVFASLGRILFVIALALKFHYLIAYKKHKKLVDKYRNS